MFNKIKNKIIDSTEQIKLNIGSLLNNISNDDNTEFIKKLNYISLLKKNEEKIVKQEDMSNTLFLQAIKKQLNIDDLYKDLPYFIEKSIKNDSDTLSKIDIENLRIFKENVLNIKLFIFQKIEQNPEKFKEFEMEFLKLNVDNNKIDTEYNSKLLALSFYLYDISKIEDIEQSIKEAKDLIDSNFMNTILPTELEIEILKTNNIFNNKDGENVHANISSGLEYEWWMKKVLFESNNQKGKMEKIMDTIDVSPNKKITKKSKNEENPSEYEKPIMIKEEHNTKGRIKQHHFEIVSKKFNSLSEMLIFHNLTLNNMKTIKVENQEGLIVNQQYKFEEELSQEEYYKKYPGSIHFNISLDGIEDINKVKFFLFLKESDMITKWKSKDENGILKDRNEHVQDLDKIIDIFGEFSLETEIEKTVVEFDEKMGRNLPPKKEGIINRSWNINFEHLIDEDGKKRLEIRFMGGDKYEDRKEDINQTILHILNATKNAMDIDNDSKISKKVNDKYEKLLDNFVKKELGNFKKLKKSDQKLLIKLFKTNDENLIIEKYNDIQTKIEKYVEKQIKTRGM